MWFPAVTDQAENGKIKGELYEVLDPVGIEMLDQVENVPQLYTREIVNIKGEEVYIYVSAFNPELYEMELGEEFK